MGRRDDDIVGGTLRHILLVALLLSVGNGAALYFAVTPDSHLVVLNSARDTLWKSSAGGGGISDWELLHDSFPKWKDMSDSMAAAGAALPYDSASAVDDSLNATVFAGRLRGNVTGNVSGSAQTLQGKDTTALWNAKTVQGKDTTWIKGLTPPGDSSWRDATIEGMGLNDTIGLLNTFGYLNSGGRISGGVITAGGGTGKVIVSPSIGFIKATNTDTGAIKYFTTPQCTLTMVDSAVNYIFVYYNAGTPRCTSTTNRDAIHTGDQFTLGRAYRLTADLDVMSMGTSLANYQRRQNERLLARGNMERMSGCELSGITGCYLKSTGGVFYVGNDKLTTGDFASDTVNFEHYYYKYKGAWLEFAATGKIDSLRYNLSTVAGSESLRTLSAGNYGVHWIYMCFGGDLNVIMGVRDYNTLAAAETSSAPATVPDYISKFNILVGRIIIKKSASTFTNITSAWASTFANSPVTSHNDLAGLNDADYKHLTAAEYAALDTASWAALLQGKDTTALFNAKTLQGKDTTWVKSQAGNASTLQGKDTTALFNAKTLQTKDTTWVKSQAGNATTLQGKDTTALWNAKTLQGKDTTALFNAKTAAKIASNGDSAKVWGMTSPTTQGWMTGGGGATYTDTMWFAPQVLSDGSTINWNLASGGQATVTLGGNRTIANPTNVRNGRLYSLTIIQDSTGTRLLTWGANYHTPGGVDPVLSAGGYSTPDVDIFQFIGCNDSILRMTNGSFDLK